MWVANIITGKCTHATLNTSDRISDFNLSRALHKLFYLDISIFRHFFIFEDISLLDIPGHGDRNDVDRRSIIDCKEITKKDITEFLNKKMKDPTNKSSVQKLLEDQGIGLLLVSQLII